MAVPSTVIDHASQAEHESALLAAGAEGDTLQSALSLLVVATGISRSYPLPEGQTINIGRSPQSHVQIDDPRASRLHARMHRGVDLTIEDVGSGNGTWMRRAKLTAHQPFIVMPGETITIGDVIMMIRQTPGARSPKRRDDTCHASNNRPCRFLLDRVMQPAWTMAMRAAAGTINVLLLGETGAGKEVLARSIHDASARAAGPFIAINCAALAEQLAESELFGHEKGAYTGAGAARPGLIEAADGGTVLLDEIGDMPHAMQAKLLRVLEAREVTRIGSVRPRKLDVRFIAATNRDLEAEAVQGRFRADLYYRLAGAVITVPPLRGRLGAIEQFAHRFVAAFARQEGRPAAPALTQEAMAALWGYPWPGNVRELRNVIERALLLLPEGEGEILPSHLPETFLAPRPAAVTAGAQLPAADQRTGSSYPETERARVIAALSAASGNQTRAARTLGMSRKAFIARLNAFGIARPQSGRQGGQQGGRPGDLP